MEDGTLSHRHQFCARGQKSWRPFSVSPCYPPVGTRPTARVNERLRVIFCPRYFQAGVASRATTPPGHYTPRVTVRATLWLRRKTVEANYAKGNQSSLNRGAACSLYETDPRTGATVETFFCRSRARPFFWRARCRVVLEISSAWLLVRRRHARSEVATTSAAMCFGFRDTHHCRVPTRHILVCGINEVSTPRKK